MVSKNFIKKGSVLSKKNICLKRPGNGDFATKNFLKLLGKKVNNDIFKNVQIKKKDLKF